jgi:hypothetical protein
MAPVLAVILLLGVPFLVFCLFHFVCEINPRKQVDIIPLSSQADRGWDARASFPLFVLAKGDYSMFQVETPDKILCHMKRHEIESDEYMFWDARGRGVRISICGRQVAGMALCKPEISLGDAFRRYSDVHGLDADTTGPFDQVWCRLKQDEVSSHGRKTSL